MEAPVVIDVEGLGKRYRLGVIGGATLSDEVKVALARLRGRPNPLVPVGKEVDGQRVGEHFWSLRDVSSQVRQGEILGIVGKNGAGKSTLLKLLSRITLPTTGQVRMKGRNASLLEVGTGFHPELTGRENIYLNGAILGMRRAEIDRKLEEIVAFSGIQHHIDTPTKRYSSGMKVRLGFAVAAHLEPEILIIDEVLAVGDAEFQRKCLGKMREVSTSGRTILFVSHNMASVRSLCSRVIWLHDGTVHRDGDTDTVVRDYLSTYSTKRALVEWTLDQAPEAGGTRLTRVEVHAPERDEVLSVRKPLHLDIDLHTELTDGDLNVGIHVYNGDDILAFAGSWRDACPEHPRLTPGHHRLRCTVPGDLLNEGEYRVVVNFFRRGKLLLQKENTVTFEMHDLERQGSYFGVRKGVFRPRLAWQSTPLNAG